MNVIMCNAYIKCIHGLEVLSWLGIYGTNQMLHIDQCTCILLHIVLVLKRRKHTYEDQTSHTSLATLEEWQTYSSPFPMITVYFEYAYIHTLNLWAVNDLISYSANDF